MLTRNLKLKILFLIAILFLFLGKFHLVDAACGGAYTKVGKIVYTYNSSNECLQDAIDVASFGDTIQVSDGDAVWSPLNQGCGQNTYLCFSKPIKLAGGSGIIKFSEGTIYGGIRYRPDDTAIGNTFEVFGFTFDAEGKNLNGMGLIHIQPKTSSELPSAYKIHHNKFLNFGHTCLMIEGLSYGVTYLNTFTNVSYPSREQNGGLEANGGAWASIPQTFGTQTYHFFEDNLINVTDMQDEVGIVDPGHGTMGVVYRYNDVNLSGGNLTSQTSLWTAHGLQSMHQSYFLSGLATGGSTTTLVDSTRNFVSDGVLVGDTVMRNSEYQVTYPSWQVTSISTTVNPNDTLHFVSKTAFVAGDSYHISHWLCPSGCGYENCTNTAGITGIQGSCDGDDRVCNRISTLKQEVYGNRVNPGNHYFVPWMSTRGGANLHFMNYLNPPYANTDSYYKLMYAQYSCNSCSQFGTQYNQAVSNSYNWVNYAGPKLVTMEKGLDGCADAANGYAIKENVDYWNHKLDFKGSSGVGCGTLANRPAACTAGVGYWATDQSCTDLTGMVGKNPANPISGTLYKCVSENTWEKYYEPYAYPHPLRNENDIVSPSFPVGLSVR